MWKYPTFRIQRSSYAVSADYVTDSKHQTIGHIAAMIVVRGITDPTNSSWSFLRYGCSDRMAGVCAVKALMI
ncbi:MAG: hypothetical protein Q4D85_09965 [Corynebacterium sp.]|uniref:hypothetical protein n=1 Tax=Corynebacterium TaxID=1716 RepID=UPI00118736EA|nr:MULTISPECIES: hypothetical protein [Corynebacterium]MDO5099069.1 hypothetical protein [Corynebacterium sp.]